ncbi:MAG: serine hydrolase [Chloroflexi bacterium]|nr:serine hydrolase [Chloroflexota bacterium]
MRRGGPDLLRLISIGLLLLAVSLVFYELVTFSRERARLPDQLTIAGVPVGDLEKTEALERLLQVYGSPVELFYGDEVILLNPSSVGYRLDTEVMLAASELARTEVEFWSGFWDFLWNRPGEPNSIPLKSEFSQSELEMNLRDIALRYDKPSKAAEPIPGSPTFAPGESGRVLDIARARELVGEILNTPVNRRVNLPVVAEAPPRPTLPTLQILLKQILKVTEFDGLAVIYLQEMQTGDELHFAILAGEEIEVEPDIAFTAASTIKIGVMTAFYRYFDEPLDEEAERWLYEMIVLSGNATSDWLVERLEGIDELGSPGPVLVTNTLRDLGMESTYLGGYFRIGSPLLIQPQTSGNQRPDITTSPDPYNQTTASEIATLLVDIYRCSQGGGALMAAFGGVITAEECANMLDLLSQNKLGYLIEAGVPDGTRVAHKQGYTDSPLDYVIDTGVVFTAGGNYTLSIFLWNELPMIWDPTAKLVSNLSRAVYNYFNPPLEN